MNMDMTNYKVIHNNKVYNCISMSVFFSGGEIEGLEVIYINEDSRVSLLKGATSEFQFISK
ncbi:MAG: hypothetical protein M0Q88_08505 [Bacilli bacterium]|nr:hypothetical protein [Bacilli bacterium]